MDRCPCCNARLRERTICSRCKTDLTTVIDSNQAAHNWLNKAILYWQQGHIEPCIFALETSIALKNSALAYAFRDFIIQQQSQDILELLAQKQQFLAKQALFKIQSLLPHSQTLQKLNAFSDYLYLSEKQS